MPTTKRRRLLIAIAAGAAADVVALAAFTAYSWTAMHSGWSDGVLRAYQIATLVAPAALGFATGWIVYRKIRQ